MDCVYSNQHVYTSRILYGYKASYENIPVIWPFLCQFEKQTKILYIMYAYR